ncbi:MAG: insulinase family protein [Saprospiraceae bacterium]|nr:insulinase family protein [Saprospiraceae bacterium]
MVKYERFELSNGLKVLLHQDGLTPLVAVNLLFKAGSKFDPRKKSGLAHLFEHLMFSGTRAVPDFDEPIQMAGAENNAFTNSDYANYYSYGPYQNLETLLWLEADRLKHLRVNKKEFRTQQKVVIEELHESCFNVPYGDIWHHLLPSIYEFHPYQWPTIGLTESEIASITLEDIHQFYKDYYNVSNCILSIAGNFDLEKTKTLVEQYFSDAPPNQTNVPDFIFDQKEYTAKELTVSGDVPVPAFFVAYPMPSRISADYYKLDLVSDLLSMGRSSLFYKSLIKETQVLSYADAYITGTHDTGLFIIEGKLSEGVTFATARSEISKIIDQLVQDNIEERVMQKLKNGLESSVVFSEISTLSKAMNLAYFELIGDVDPINTEPENYRKIQREDISKMVGDYLRSELATTILYLPK